MNDDTIRADVSHAIAEYARVTGVPVANVRVGLPPGFAHGDTVRRALQGVAPVDELALFHTPDGGSRLVSPGGFVLSYTTPAFIDDQPITPMPTTCTRFVRRAACGGKVRPDGGFMVCDRCGVSYGAAGQ